MKFVYTKGDFAQFRGRTFLWGKPTDITEKATIQALLKNPDYRKVDDETKETTTEAVLVPKSGPACPKCGKVIVRGMYFHQKYCKG